MPLRGDANAGTSRPVSLRSLLCHQAGLLDPEDSFDSLAPGETALLSPLDLGFSECRFEQPLLLDAPQQIAAKGHTPSGEVLAVGEPVYPYPAAAGLWCTALLMPRFCLK